jgi:hypothetical protein
MYGNTQPSKVSDMPIGDQIKYYEELVTRLPIGKAIPILKKIVELKALQKQNNGL